LIHFIEELLISNNKYKKQKMALKVKPFLLL